MSSIRPYLAAMCAGLLMFAPFYRPTAAHIGSLADVEEYVVVGDDVFFVETQDSLVNRSAFTGTGGEYALSIRKRVPAGEAISANPFDWTSAVLDDDLRLFGADLNAAIAETGRTFSLNDEWVETPTRRTPLVLHPLPWHRWFLRPSTPRA